MKMLHFDKSNQCVFYLIMTLQEIKDYLYNVVQPIELVGNPQTAIQGISEIETAQQGELAFVANSKYERFLESTNASAVIVSNKIDKAKLPGSKAYLLAGDPYIAFVFILEKLSPMRKFIQEGISESAFIDPTAEVDQDVSIGAGAYIGQNCQVKRGAKIGPNVSLLDGVVVGEDSMIYPNVTVYDECRIGNRVIVHAGATIGADGFGFAPQPDGSYHKIPQVGIVVLEDDVELGANLCIDRATIGETRVKRGTKIDNLVQVGHNCSIGSNTVIASQVGVSGSVTIGNQCMVGGQAGFVGHIEMADKMVIGAQAGITKSFNQEGLVIRGAPAQPIRDQMKQEVMLRKLGDMMERIKQLELQLQQMNDQKLTK